MESSPSNDTLSFMNPSDVLPYLNSLVATHNAGSIMVGLTGGEPFANPNILGLIEVILEHELNVRLLIITTASGPMWNKKDKLFHLLNDRVTIRVSLDHYTQKKHELRRRSPGQENLPVWEPAIRGLQWLCEMSQYKDFIVGITGQPWSGETYRSLMDGYEALAVSLYLSIDSQDIILFPALIENHDMNESSDFLQEGITQACMDTYKKTLGDFMCSRGGMLVKEGDIVSLTPCTLIPYNHAYRITGSPESIFALEKVTSISLNHKNCMWCLSGGSCSG